MEKRTELVFEMVLDETARCDAGEKAVVGAAAMAAANAAKEREIFMVYQ